MSVVSKSFMLVKRTLKRPKQQFGVVKTSKHHFVQTADKAVGSQTRSFQFSQVIFRFCCPGFKPLMTSDLLTVWTRPSPQFSFFFSPHRAPQHLLWKPWRPTQSSTKRQRPFCCGGPGAVQLRARLRPWRPRHSHLCYQCWKHCRMGLSCTNLSRYAQLNVCGCMWSVYLQRWKIIKSQ